MDLVAQAGIDVSAWAIKRDPKNPERSVPVAEPRANPNYCYEWAFGDEAQGYVLCVWHASLKVVQLPEGPAIGYGENIRELALSLDRIAIDRTRDTAERNRARDQARRARAFDVAIQRAFRKQVPVRLIINEGDRRPLEELGKSRSTVKLRALDSELWFVHDYDDGGLPLLVRGVQMARNEAPDDMAAAAVASSQQLAPSVQVEPDAASPPPAPVYVDQFAALAPAATREATVMVRERSAAVRERVLRRAAGHCEWCGRPGFLTVAGAVYLETHHVVPLADDGPDHESNVIALCPEDHRRAHCGHDRDDMMLGLLVRLAAVLSRPEARRKE
jgi:5-methylcytosine-specific restriction enzyme A